MINSDKFSQEKIIAIETSWRTSQSTYSRTEEIFLKQVTFTLHEME